MTPVGVLCCRISRARSHAASRSRGQEGSAAGPHRSGHGRQAERGPHRIHRRVRTRAKRQRAAASHAIRHEAAESPGVRDQGAATGSRHRFGQVRSITPEGSSVEVPLGPGRPGGFDQKPTARTRVETLIRDVNRMMSHPYRNRWPQDPEAFVPDHFPHRRTGVETPVRPGTGVSCLESTRFGP